MNQRDPFKNWPIEKILALADAETEKALASLRNQDGASALHFTNAAAWRSYAQRRMEGNQ